MYIREVKHQVSLSVCDNSAAHIPVPCAAEGSVCCQGFSVLQKVQCAAEGSACYRGFSVSSLCQCVMTLGRTHTCPLCYRGFWADSHLGSFSQSECHKYFSA